MKPTYWFCIAAALFGAAISCVEIGVKAYVTDDHWDKALRNETAKVTDGVSRDGR